MPHAIEAPTTVTALLARARSAVGHHTRYKLGGGGMRPSEPTPGAKDRPLDCSGYVCWCLGLSRFTDHPFYRRVNGGWINTDAMVADALAPVGFFTRLAEPRVGAIIVFPKQQSHKVGHVGLVTSVAGMGGGGAKVVTGVLHCSSGNWRRHGDAIRETDDAVFRTPKTLYAWYEGIEAG